MEEQQDKQETQTPDEQIRDYLARDLAAAKLQLNESKRNTGKLLMLVIILIFLIAVCVAGFAATVFFITKEQTKQIQAIFSSDWEIRTQEQATHIYQDAGSGGGTAVINNRTRLQGSTITINPPKE